MKQKLGLASALVTRPRVLLLDEPTTGVDPVTRQDFWQLVIRLVTLNPHPSPESGREEEGEPVAVLLTTPYMDEASRCHRVGFMSSGRIVAEGAPSELRAALEGCVIELRGQPMALLRQVATRMEGVEDVHAFGDKLHLRVVASQTDRVIQHLFDAIPAAGGSLVTARLVPPTLEDVFISLAK